MSEFTPQPHPLYAAWLATSDPSGRPDPEKDEFIASAGMVVGWWTDEDGEAHPVVARATSYGDVWWGPPERLHTGRAPWLAFSRDPRAVEEHVNKCLDVAWRYHQEGGAS